MSHCELPLFAVVLIHEPGKQPYVGICVGIPQMLVSRSAPIYAATEEALDTAMNVTMDSMDLAMQQLGEQTFGDAVLEWVQGCLVEPVHPETGGG